MKQSPDLQRIQNAMRAGALSQTGFLGRDPRNLADILTADDADVRRLGLTHEGIADRLEALRAAGAGGLGLAVRVEPHYEVRLDGVRGALACPFGHPGLFEKTFCVVRNMDRNEEIVFTDLNIHMIRAHGFYEGEGAPFRLAPARLARVLDLAPGA